MKQMKPTKLHIIATMTLLALLVALPALAKTTIRYQYNWYAVANQNAAFQEAIDEFNRSQDEIFVDGFVVSGTYDQLLTSIAGGAQADVVHFEASAIIEWAARGLLEPIDEFYPGESLTPELMREYFLTADADEVIWQDRVWGIPGYTNARGIFWNIDLVNEIGMDSSRAPATMEELEELARRGLITDGDGNITRVGFAPWDGSFGSAGWMWAFGGDIYDPATGMPTLNRDENARAWEWMQDWAQRFPPSQFSLSYAGPSASAHGRFMGGSYVAVTAADNSIANFQRIAPELNFAAGEAPHPAGGRNGSWGGGIGHIIPVGTEHKEEAITFLRWMSTEGQRILYKHHAQFPTRREVADEIRANIDPEDPRVPLFMQMDNRNPRPPLWAKVIGRLNSLQSSEIITLNQNPRDVLENLQREFGPQYEMLLGDR